MSDSDNPQPVNEANAETSETTGRTNIFYRLTMAPVIALIVTVLSFVALLMGDPAAPANRFLNRYGYWLIAGEVLLSLLFGLMALAVDRRRIVEARNDEVSCD